MKPKTLGEIWGDNRTFSCMRVRDVEKLEDFLLVRPINFQQGRPVFMGIVPFERDTSAELMVPAYETKWCLLSPPDELKWLQTLAELQAIFHVRRSYRRVLVREACEPY